MSDGMSDHLRAWLIAAVIACSWGGMALAGSPAARAENAAVSFRTDAERSGRIAGPSPAPPLARLWKRNLGGPVGYALLAEGKVFVPAWDGSGYTLYALDRASGATLWSHKLDESAMRIAYGNGRIAAVATDGVTQGFDAATGNTLWAHGVSGTAPDPWGGPIVVDGSVVYSGDYTTESGVILSEALTNGAERWRHHGGAANLSSNGSTVFGLGECPKLLALDSADGSEVWRNSPQPECGSRDGVQAAYHDGKVFSRDFGPYDPSPYQGELPTRAGAVLSAVDGKVIRRLRADSALAFSGNTAVFIRHGALQAEDDDTGVVKWTSTLPERVHSAPIIVGSHVYTASADGTVYAVDLETGRQEWTDEVSESIPSEEYDFDQRLIYRQDAPSGMSAGQGVLAVPSAHSLTVYADSEPPPTPADPPALTPGGGEGGRDEALTYRGNPSRTAWTASSPLRPPLHELWSQPVSADQMSYPLIAGGRTFVIAQTGHYYPANGFTSELRAFDSATGRPLWSVPLAAGRQQPWEEEAAFFALAYGGNSVVSVNGSGELQALSAATGEKLWQYRLGPSTNVSAAPVVDAERVFVAETCEGPQAITALSLTTGRRLWGPPASSRCGSYNWTEGPGLAASPSALYLSGQGRVSSFAASTGATRWNKLSQIEGAGTKSPAFIDGRLYTRDDFARGLILDGASGAVRGAIASDEPPAFSSQLTVTADLNTVRASDRVGGRDVWQYAAPGPRSGADATNWFTAPVIVGAHVYAANRDGTLRAFALATGTEEWSGDIGAAPVFDQENYSAMSGGTAAGEGIVVVPARDRLVAYAGPAGHQLPPAEPSAAAPGATGVAATPTAPSSTTGAAPRDRTRPRIRAFTSRPRSIRPSYRRTRAGRHRGAVVLRFALSEPAAVTARIERRLGPARKPRWRRAGLVGLGRLTPGSRQFSFYGLTGAGHRLRPGSYRLTLQAVDAAGNTSGDAVTTVRLLPRATR